MNHEDGRALPFFNIAGLKAVNGNKLIRCPRLHRIITHVLIVLVRRPAFFICLAFYARRYSSVTSIQVPSGSVI